MDKSGNNIAGGAGIPIEDPPFRVGKKFSPQPKPLNASGQQWTCGVEARDRLATHIAGLEIRCVSTDIDVYGREFALCSVAGEDLNGWMVREGWALAYVKYSLPTSLSRNRPEHDRVDYGKAHSLRPGIGVTATTRWLSSERSVLTRLF
jgi:hypothetical protein